MCTKIKRVDSNRLLIQIKINCLQVFWFPHSQSLKKNHLKITYKGTNLVIFYNPQKIIQINTKILRKVV